MRRWSWPDPCGCASRPSTPSRTSASRRSRPGGCAGLTGFWMGYFGFRAAPLGAVGAGPSRPVLQLRVLRSWGGGYPTSGSTPRPRRSWPPGARPPRSSLRELAPGIEGVASHGATPCSAAAVARRQRRGPAAVRRQPALALPDDPVAALWQLCTCLREHRGDGPRRGAHRVGPRRLRGPRAHLSGAGQLPGRPAAGTWVDHRRLGRRDDPLHPARPGRQQWRAHGRGQGSAGQRRGDDRSAGRPSPSTPSDRTSGPRCSLRWRRSPSTISASGVIRYPNPMGLPAFRG